MRTRFLIALAVTGATSAAAQGTPPARPVMPQVCATCHKPADGEIRGIFENVAFKNQSIQLKIDAVTEIVRFDEKTLKVIDADQDKPVEALRDIAKHKEARIEFEMKDGRKSAKLISFKGPIKIAPERLVAYDEVARLVDLGPDKGQYTLIDSRPLPRFMEGTIPTAINLPYPAFDKFLDRLPQDKARLVIFFCSGVTCAMSPRSLQRAQALGYANAKVYREGMPEWNTKRPGVLAVKFLKEAFVDKDIPHVLVDARPAAETAAGFIAGAVGAPKADAKALLAQLPDRKLKAPIFVYDADGSGPAGKLAAAVTSAGYANVQVLTGGLAAWKQAGYPLATGSPAAKVAYVPKPRPGSIPNEEFAKLARQTPPDTLILDVRNADEAKEGMIKGALLIPDEELAARVAEIPKDKRILTHCATGVRAEMAYHKLKELGYNVAFLNAGIEIDGRGAFKIAKP